MAAREETEANRKEKIKKEKILKKKKDAITVWPDRALRWRTSGHESTGSPAASIEKPGHHTSEDNKKRERERERKSSIIQL